LRFRKIDFSPVNIVIVAFSSFYVLELLLRFVVFLLSSFTAVISQFRKKRCAFKLMLSSRSSTRGFSTGCPHWVR
jgi:hypothetical protein